MASRAFERRRQVRVADGEQRPLTQLREEHPEPETADRHRGGDIHPVDEEDADVLAGDQPPVRSPGAKLRRHEHEDVDQPDEQEPGGERHEAPRRPLQIARQEQRKRHRELEEHEEERQVLPAVVDPDQHVRDLVGQVRRVDEQVLRELEIRPEHDERERQLAVIVKVRWLQDARHRLAPGEVRRDDDRERQPRQPEVPQEDEAEHRRIEVGVERHHPVDSGSRDRQRQEDQSGAAQPLHAARRRDVAVVLRARQRSHPPRDQVPAEEIDGGAGDEERRVQVRRLVTEHGVGLHHVRMHPGIEAAHAEHDGNEEDRHQRQRAARRLPRPGAPPCPTIRPTGGESSSAPSSRGRR